MEGYDPNLFDKITEQERNEVEKDIWNHFMNKNDADLAVLMPALKNYDGIAALKKKLAEFKIPSYGSADHRSQWGWLGSLKSLECMICWLISTCMIKTRQTGGRL